MADRVFNQGEMQDRFAIMDLYDRQLAAAEAWDLTAYDTTFAEHAGIDLRDFGQPVRHLTYTGLFYNDTLARTEDGWRIVQRYEELAWSGAPGPQG